MGNDKACISLSNNKIDPRNAALPRRSEFTSIILFHCILVCYPFSCNNKIGLISHL